MKVIILGPVLNRNLSGGVAVFSENLVKGFRNIGIDANIISAAKSESIDNFVVGKGEYGSAKILLSLPKIAKIIQKEKPDLVISSLQYNLGIRSYKKKSPGTKFISVLHGMSCPVDGRIKSRLVNFVAKYSYKHFDKTAIVSFISMAVNWKIYRIPCDAVVPNGIEIHCPDNKDLFDQKTFEQEKNYDFLYVGRLYRDKRVDLLCRAFIELKKRHTNLRMAVVGGGELESKFKHGGEFCTDGISYLGMQPHDKVVAFYRQSKIFISLNELEPLGTTFMEAACEGCALASPITAGHMQLFWNCQYMHTIDISSVLSVARDMEKAFLDYSAPSTKDIMNARSRFNCESMAQRYLKLYQSIDDKK